VISAFSAVNRKMMNGYKNSMLVREFDRYVLEHPEFAEKIPNNALIIMQMDGDEEFNQWAKEAALKVAEKRAAYNLHNYYRIKTSPLKN